MANSPDKTGTLLPVDLDGWLVHNERLHPVGMDLGLDRVMQVARNAGLDVPRATVITVAGTNGKGSVVSACESALMAVGVTVGATLSPHLERFNERIRVNGCDLEDAPIVAAFNAIERSRGDITLTYFEMAALAALWCFRETAVDVIVLEIGLGGRLDAFNIVDADVAVVSTIGLDHVDYLGSDLESIGREKAGIFRAGKPALLGRDLPSSVHNRAAELGCDIWNLGADICLECEPGAASWGAASWGPGSAQLTLPGFAPVVFQATRLAPDNVALGTAAAIRALQTRGNVSGAALRDAVDAARRTRMPGRWEVFRSGGREVIVDVAHNPLGARFIRRQRLNGVSGEVYAVFGSVADKDAAGVIDAIDPAVARWYVVDTTGLRGRAGATLAQIIGSRAQAFADVGEAVSRALSDNAAATVLVFGAFEVVGKARKWLIARGWQSE